MKVLAVIVTPPHYSASGAVTAAKKLTEAVSSRISVELAIMGAEDSIEQGDRLTTKYFRCHNPLRMLSSIAPKQLSTACWNSKIPDYIRSSKPDIVHIHNPVPPLAMWAIAKSCHENNIPYVITTHGFVEFFDIKRAFNVGKLKSLALSRMVMTPFMKTLNYASAILPLSEQELPMLRNAMKTVPKTYVIPNGYDPFYEEVASNQFVDQVTQRFHLDHKKPIFLFMGNHTFNKGLDVLLRALRYIEEDVLIIIGGKIRSQAEHSELLNSTGVSHDDKRLIFTDFLEYEETRVLYQLADCFVFPTRADTFPLVILEAMISKLPVISTKIGGIPSQIDESCGILLDADDPENLASAIDYMARNKEIRETMGLSGYEKVRRLFSWDKAAQLAVDAYQSVVQNYSPTKH